jgi:hypothetical protein
MSFTNRILLQCRRHEMFIEKQPMITITSPAGTTWRRNISSLYGTLFYFDIFLYKYFGRTLKTVIMHRWKFFPGLLFYTAFRQAGLQGALERGIGRPGAEHNRAVRYRVRMHEPERRAGRHAGRHIQLKL